MCRLEAEQVGRALGAGERPLHLARSAVLVADRRVGRVRELEDQAREVVDRRLTARGEMNDLVVEIGADLKAAT